MPKKLPTGINELDKRLGGGIIKGSILLVVGEPGSGKTSLLRQFLKEAAKKKEPAVYFLTNRSFDRTRENLPRSGFDKNSGKNTDFILYDGMVQTRDESLIGNYRDLLDIAYNLEKLFSKKEGKQPRLILDDLSHLFLNNSKDVVFKFINRMNQIFRKRDVTALLEVQKGMLDPQIITALESLTDGTVETESKEGRRRIRVARLSEDSVSDSWIELRLFEDEAGKVERALNDWQRVLVESDSKSEEERVRQMINDMRAEKEGGTKGIFHKLGLSKK